MINLGIRFLLELCLLTVVGYWGFKTGSGWFLKILLGIGTPEMRCCNLGLVCFAKSYFPLKYLPAARSGSHSLWYWRGNATCNEKQFPRLEFRSNCCHQ